MFISGYSYSKTNYAHKSIGDNKFIEHIYTFRGKTGKRYIVIVEQYDYFVFIVKFCLQEHKNYSDRFNRLTKINECSRVLTTIGFIMRELFRTNPYASFGFIGSNLPKEQEENTKRFRLYSKVVNQLVSPVDFEHYEARKSSAYLLLNRNNEELDLLNKITVLFNNLTDRSIQLL